MRTTIQIVFELQLQEEQFKLINDRSPFVGPLISLFWTTADVSSGFGNGHVKRLDV